MSSATGSSSGIVPPRLTNGLSKKVESLKAAVALQFACYNFVRVHRTTKLTPAMAAGVAGSHWTMTDLLDVTVLQ